MKTLNIFIASPIKNCQEERSVAKRAILQLGHEPILLEDIVDFGVNIENITREMIIRSDLVIGILGPKYSASTAKEIRCAIENKKQLLAYVNSKIATKKDIRKYKLSCQEYVNNIDLWGKILGDVCSFIEELEAERIAYQSSRDVIIQQPVEKVKEKEKEKLAFPFEPSLHNQTPPEVNFVGREDMLETITKWYKNPDVRIGVLIGWGGVGKSALVRKWYDSLEENKIQPDGIFWWGFYRNAYLEQCLNALLRYVSGGQVEPDTIKGTWEKTESIKEYIGKGAYLIILDGLEQMQKAEAGDEFGKMIHRELTELLHYLADVPQAGGLCLITTRFALKDLADWEGRGYENRPLIGLSVPDALLMLKKRGIKGSDEEMTEVIKRYKGHALSLTSLAGYLVRYYDGDIKEAPYSEFVLSDKERFKDVNKLLRKYAEKMSEAERVFLNIFSLFRQAVTEGDFGGVIRHKIKGTEFNKLLIKMSELDFADLVNGLVDWRLISKALDKTYATHPLIKAYFESDFSEKNKKLCHKRIYEYIEEYAPEMPETLEEIQPLFEQVYHGCAAGLYQKTFDEVFYAKINKRKAFLVHFLGAWGTNLSLVRNFFPKCDPSQIPLVSRKSDQSFLLNEAGLALINTGHPKKAKEVFKIKLEMNQRDRQWEAASVGYQHMAELQLLTGELESGLGSAKKALEKAVKIKSEVESYYSKFHIAWALYLLGETKKAIIEFGQTNKLAWDIWKHSMHSAAGVYYASLLLLIGRTDEAFTITRDNLEFCQRQNWSIEISRCYSCLGSIERRKGKHKEAEDHLQKAVEIGHKVGTPFVEIEALLESGKLNLDMGRYEDAICDADNALKICGRTGFRFYEPGAEIVLARAYLALEDFEKAESNAKSAYEKAVGMKYRWAEGDAADLLGEIYSVRGDKAKGREWLKKAVVCRKEILNPKVKETEEKLKKIKD